MGGSDAGSGSKSKSRSLSSSSARRSSPSPQKRHEPSSGKRKKRRSPSSASSSSSSTSPSREKKTKKKKKQREVKKLKCEKKKEKKWQKKLALKAERAAASVSTADEHPQTYLKTWQCEEIKRHFSLAVVMTDEQKGRLCTKRPMTKEDYEARQSVIRRALDPETSHQLVRGDGEILEEIVSKERHQEVNKVQSENIDAEYKQRQLKFI
uniref:ADP-ribosylation factor-like protein 6-interacting protein 4 n=1 Tax=Cyprinus carpio TaxID=7962 RepID=A0A8C1Y7S1_CYPCA